MKINWNKQYTTIAIYACIVSAITIVSVFIGVNVGGIAEWFAAVLSFLNPIIAGFIIAYLCNPLMNIFEKHIFRFVDRGKARPRLKRALSLILTYLVYFIIIGIVFALIIPQVIVSYNDLISKMQMYIDSAEQWLSSIIGAVPFLNIDAIFSYINELLNDSYGILQSVTPYLTGFFSSFIGQLTNALLGIILSIYFLLSKEKLTAQVKKALYAFASKRHGDQIIHFARYTDRTFGGFIMGKLLDSLIIGILTFIVLAIFNMPYYQLISVIIGVTNIIPFFGPFIGAIPSVFIIFIAEPIKALWFIIIIIVIQQLDGNVIGPKILGESTGLSSLGVIVAITVMGGLLGVVGMFIGVPLFALLYMGLKTLLNRRIEKRQTAQEQREADDEI